MIGNRPRHSAFRVGIRLTVRGGLPILAAIMAALPGPTAALEITGYSAAVNDRFTSGFPSNPLPNTSGSFVGADYDWSGVSWSTTVYSGYKNLALLSPRHFLSAWHYEHPQLNQRTLGVRIRGLDGVVVSQSTSAVFSLQRGLFLDNRGYTGYDVAVGILAAPITASDSVARYAVYDRFSTSTSTAYSVYNGLSLLVVGRGSTTNANSSPRVGTATVDLAAAFNSDSRQVAIRTTRSNVAFVEGDSAGPTMHGWTNPNGQAELTLVAVNSATDFASYNYMSMLATPAAMATATDLMALDGYALRVAGDPTATWVGNTSTDITDRRSWGISGSGTAPSDAYVLFSGTTASSRSVSVDSATNLRGLYFKSTGSGTLGFTFSGASTLTLGRGGLTNYDASRQTFSGNLTLGDTQYWDVGAGGVTAANITTNGWLLEIAGSGTSRITGAVSGAGGLALSGHRLELTGSSSYTGGTWVHGGTLVVNGTIAASSGVSVDAGAVLAGSGRVSGISGAGSVGPGNSPGILTATSVNPTGGLDFSFEFGKTGSPIWATGTASGNDVLRLTDASTPFTSSLGASNAIDVYLAATTLAYGDTFQGGFFTDASGDFLARIQNASFTYYVLGNGLGTAKTYNGQGYYLLDTTFWPAFEEVVLSTVSVASANFADGTVTNGRVMQIMMVPEPAGIWLVVAAGATTIATRRRATRG